MYIARDLVNEALTSTGNPGKASLRVSEVRDGLPRRGGRLSRQPLERRETRADLVEFLLVDREDCHVGTAEHAWIIKCADFDDHRGHSPRAGDEVGSAIRA